MKRLANVKNPGAKKSQFQCDTYNIQWINPVPYFIRTPHPAINSLVDYFEYMICKKCTIKEIGTKNKKKEWFFNEE